MILESVRNTPKLRNLAILALATASMPRCPTKSAYKDDIDAPKHHQGGRDGLYCRR